MDSNTLTKVDIYNYIYTEGNSEFNYASGQSTIDSQERFITSAKINSDLEGYIPFLSYCLNKAKSVDSRTICMDYRLFTDETIKELEEAYKNGNILGIRLYPEDAILTEEIQKKFDKSSFKGLLISANNIESYNSEYLDIRNQQNICKIEKIRFNENDSIEEKIHITRKLSQEEIHVLANIIKENSYNEILVDFYEPGYYRKLLEALKKENISKDIKIRLLANPLYDESELYEGLDDILDNQINIRYNTCKDLNDFYRDEPYTSGAIYLSDIEASGLTSVKNYKSMIDMLDEVISVLEERKYSPLEKVAYIHDYFKKNYHYNSDYYKDPDEKNNRDLDRVYDKDKMICEGFSNLYSALLRRAGILCFTYGTDNHQKNIIRIKDEKYGIDNLAIIDPTWDLANYNNRNIFSNFLVPIDNDLYAATPEVINIPTALTINNGTYSSYIKESNPIYSTEVINYAIRMLQLMGLGRENENEYVTEDDINFYKSALANGKLTERIPTEKLVDAIYHVRKTENDYLGEIDENYDYEQIQENVDSRGNPHDITPRIKLFDNTEIQTRYYVPNKDINFVEKDNQYVKFHRPRKKYENESDTEYRKYLEEFYHKTFYEESIHAENRIDEIEDSQKNAETDKNIKQEDSLEKQKEVIKIYKDNNKLYATSDVFHKFQIQLPNEYIDLNNEKIYELNEMIACLLLNYHNSMNSLFEIRFSNISLNEIENKNSSIPEYEIIDDEKNNQDITKTEDEDLIPGTNFKKPRGRGIYETDDEYVEYLEYYYNSIFPPENNDIREEKQILETNEDLIPGTNFKKPRGRGIYETDDEYVEFLEEYYKSIFGEEIVENSKKGKVR